MLRTISHLLLLGLILSIMGCGGGDGDDDTPGNPDTFQGSLSLSADNCSPQAYTVDGVEVQVTARLAYDFNLPAPDGTQVVFRTERGLILPSSNGACSTIDSACTITWRSQGDRPIPGLPTCLTCNQKFSPGEDMRAGRVTILATVVGNEFFVDSNGNGLFDDAEILTLADLDEVFHDTNESGFYDDEDILKDINTNGIFDIANGLYDGTLCAAGSTMCTGKQVHMHDEIVIVMATNDTIITPPASPIAVAGGPVDFSVIVSDENFNSPPQGTTISVETTNGEILGPSTDVVGGCVTEPHTAEFTVGPEGMSDSGTLTITVTTPSGVTESETVTVTD